MGMKTRKQSQMKAAAAGGLEASASQQQVLSEEEECRDAAPSPSPAPSSSSSSPSPSQEEEELEEGEIPTQPTNKRRRGPPTSTILSHMYVDLFDRANWVRENFVYMKTERLAAILGRDYIDDRDVEKRIDKIEKKCRENGEKRMEVDRKIRALLLKVLSNYRQEHPRLTANNRLREIFERIDTVKYLGERFHRDDPEEEEDEIDREATDRDDDPTPPLPPQAIDSPSASEDEGEEEEEAGGEDSPEPQEESTQEEEAAGEDTMTSFPPPAYTPPPVPYDSLFPDDGVQTPLPIVTPQGTPHIVPLMSMGGGWPPYSFAPLSPMPTLTLPTSSSSSAAAAPPQTATLVLPETAAAPPRPSTPPTADDAEDFCFKSKVNFMRYQHYMETKERERTHLAELERAGKVIQEIKMKQRDDGQTFGELRAEQEQYQKRRGEIEDMMARFRAELGRLDKAEESVQARIEGTMESIKEGRKRLKLAEEHELKCKHKHEVFASYLREHDAQVQNVLKSVGGMVMETNRVYEDICGDE